MSEWRAKNPRLSRGFNHRLRVVTFKAYGERCARCDEDDIDVLCIDHINNDGAAHRKKIGGGGVVLYQWLKNNNWPTGFQTLCWNCNIKKEKERRRAT